MKQTESPRLIYKINAKRFADNKWNLDKDFYDVLNPEEIVSLGDNQLFRLILEVTGIENNKNAFVDYLFVLVCDNKKYIKRALGKKGLVLNGYKFRRFVGTTGGLKNNSVLFIRDEIYEQINSLVNCGRNEDIPLVPAKFEAYKALVCSTSTPIPSPKGILVVSDTFAKFKGDVIDIDDSHIKTPEDGEPIITYMNDIPLENNVSDGSNLITSVYAKRIADSLGLDYIPSGFCIRNAWCKGMANVLDFHDYVDKDTVVVDIWGNEQRVYDVEMILTESSLKLWECYSSINEYVEQLKINRFTFSVTKVAPEKLETKRTINYQYLQSYNFSDTDIQELVRPTTEFLKKSCGGDYKSTLEFLGVDENTRKLDYSKALQLDERMLKDPYIIDKINGMIAKKIDQAKIGKLFVDGNYQIFTLDPSVFLVDKLGTGKALLKAGECYSKYWSDLGVTEILAFRSPMTSMNNIRKLKVVTSPEMDKMFEHMDTMLIVNAYDTFCMAENGEDGDYINSPL